MGRLIDDQIVVQAGYVPVIDIALARAGDPAARDAVGGIIDRTCRDSGFLVITGHGIPADLIDRTYDVTLEFFCLPDKVKKRWEVEADDPTIRGLYLTAGYVAASGDVETAPDLCELFTMNRLGEPGVAAAAGLGEHFDVWSSPNRWPDQPSSFRKTWLEYYAALEALSADLMRLFALGLNLDERFFDDKIDQHITNLCANYYPVVDDEPLEGQYRKGPHSDWGTLTVLYQDAGGLEVLHRQTGDWFEVPVMPGSFVVNIGDLMAIWTNDLWLSTKHRVRVPTGTKRMAPRISIPFFHQPNWSATVECLPSCRDGANPPRHEPVTSGAYLLHRIQASYG